MKVKRCKRLNGYQQRHEHGLSCQLSLEFLFLPVAQSAGCCRMQGILEWRSGGQGVVCTSHKTPLTTKRDAPHP